MMFLPWPPNRSQTAGGYVGAAVPGSCRYFCTVLDESPRIYASAMALAIEGFKRDSRNEG